MASQSGGLWWGGELARAAPRTVAHTHATHHEVRSHGLGARVPREAPAASARHPQTQERGAAPHQAAAHSQSNTVHLRPTGRAAQSPALTGWHT